MQKLLFAGVALLLLAVATPAFAESKADAGAVVGGTTAGVAGGTIGFLVGGPIGAVVGGFAGAVIGAEAGISASTISNLLPTTPSIPLSSMVR